MKALVKAKSEPGLWMEEVEKPVCGQNDVLIRVRKTAICGTDMHIYNWDEWARHTIPVPMTVGHEYVGTIVEVGSNVADFKEGDRVSGEGHITCGHCRNCRAGKRHLCRNTSGVGVNRAGAFAEYVAIPASNAYPLPDDVPDDLAAILDPMGNAAHTALSFDLVGEDVLITGAGPIGLMSIPIAKHAGARHVVITDVNDYRLSLAEKLGASRALNVSKSTLAKVMDDLKMTEGFDVGLEMSGNPQAFRGMLDAMNHGGKVALLGLQPSDTAIDWSDLIFKSLTLKGVYGREMFETWYKMTALLQSGMDLTPVLTHWFPIDRFEEGFSIMNSGQSGKVILDWS